ncbi:MAG: AraC family transcriptional regulator [Xanthobacteraceae bacterium]
MSVAVIPAQESSHLAGRAPIAKLSISIPLGRTSEEAAVQCVRCGLPPRAKHRVLEYIVTHLNENITNGALAEVAGLSVCHFARMFKETVGVSPHRYVLQCRVECARELLASTDMPLSEIAIVTGFSDQSHYTRWFREIIGVTPSSYRWSTR